MQTVDCGLSLNYLQWLLCLGVHPGIFQVGQRTVTTVNSANGESYPLYPGEMAATAVFSPLL